MTAAVEPSPVHLTHGGYSAAIGSVGAALQRLRHHDRDLVFRVPAVIPTPPFAGAVLAPWPNRIANGRYRFGDQTHQLPINEVGRGNALHGLALWESWTWRDVTVSSAMLSHTVRPRPGYPFMVGLSARYALGDDGLTLCVTATNLGDADAPVGLSSHPYVSVGDDRQLDEWSLTLPCAEVLETDDRLLPRRLAPVGTVGLDFRRGSPLGSVQIDHAYTSVIFDADGRAGAALRGPDGSGVRVSWDTACRWLQVYTLHAPGTTMHRRAVALEPMTCAPDAFNSGQGLIVLGPGDSTAMSCTISAVSG